MRRALRARSLTGSFQTDRDCDDIVEQLMRGAKCDTIPPHMTQNVITILTARRKDALLHGKETTAAKMETLISELKYGPDKFEIDGTEDPIATRTRSLVRTRDFSEHDLNPTRKEMAKGKKTAEVPPNVRPKVMPLLKNSRSTKVARINYESSDRYDKAMDQLDEYQIDSRRLGPRFQRVEAIQRKLDEARMHYNDVRLQVHTQRQQYEALEAAAAEELEEKIAAESLEYGSHVPKSLPLEYSKFNANALNLRERQRKAARLRMYDDADNFSKQALALEKKQLQAQNEKFVRAFNLNRKYLDKKMVEQRECFREIWRRKKEKVSRDTTAELRQSKKAIENLEKELAEAQASCAREMRRIKLNERIGTAPVNARPGALY